MRRLFAAAALILVTHSALAIDIDTAKAQGLVGEATSGYLAAVKTPPSADVKALVEEVNSKRRAEFERTAEQTGATLQQVAHRFYELAVQRTARGHYYQDAGGNWRQK